MRGDPFKIEWKRSVDSYTGGNLADGKVDVLHPQNRGATLGREEKVLTVQNRLASKNNAGFKLHLTSFTKRIAQLRRQPPKTRSTLLPPERKTVGRIACKIESQLLNFFICLLPLHNSIYC